MACKAKLKYFCGNFWGGVPESSGDAGVWGVKWGKGKAQTPWEGGGLLWLFFIKVFI